MNEIEKAIKYFRYLANGVPKSNLLFGKPKDYENKMQMLAIQALQEKAERDNLTSSKWITWEEKFPDTKPQKENSLGVFCTACGLHSDNMHSFCPNCGAKMNDHIGEANEKVKEAN